MFCHTQGQRHRRRMRFQISRTLHCPCRRCHTLHCPCRLCPCRRAGVATLVFFTVRAGVHALPHLLAVIQQGLLPVICVFLVLLKGCLQLVVIARDSPVLRTLLRCPNVAEFCFGLAKGLHHRFRSLSRHGANPMHAWHKTNRRLGQTCMDSPHIGGSSTLLCASRQHGSCLGYGIVIFFRIIGAVIDFCMNFRWRPWRDVRFSYPTCLRTRIWDCYIYNNTFTIGTPPSHKTSILSQSRCDKPLELRSTTWFLPYTFVNCK